MQVKRIVANVVPMNPGACAAFFVRDPLGRLTNILMHS